MPTISRETFIIIVIFFILFSPAGSPPHPRTTAEKHRYENFIQLQRNETELLANSTYGHMGDNITGIVHPKNETSFIPSSIAKLSKDVWYSEQERKVIGDDIHFDSTKHVFFSNYSGKFHGFWSSIGNQTHPALQRRKMHIPDIFFDDSDDETGLSGRLNLNGTKLAAADSPLSGNPQFPTLEKIKKSGVDGNITETEGTLAISVEEVVPRSVINPNVTIMLMNIAVKDTTEGSYYTISLMGLHIKPLGNAVLTTNSLKYSGFQYLPHLLLDDTYFDEAKHLMVNYLNKTLNKYEDVQDYVIFEDEFSAADSCEFILYGHFWSVPLTERELNDIENEIEVPVGRPTKPIPTMILDSLLYSPDCALVIQSQKSDGEKYEQHWRRLRGVLVTAIVLIIAQAVLFAMQMRHTNTPSYMCKVSSLTIKIMSLMDNCIYLFSFASSAETNLALPLIAVAFLAFALTSVFELRYLVKIYQSQLNEREADISVRGTNLDYNGMATFIVMPDGTFVPPNHSSRQDEQLPIGEVQRPPSPPAQTQAQDILAQGEAAIPRKTFLYFCVTAVMFPIILIISSFSNPYRLMFEYMALLGFFSFWTPQIYRNVIRGFRQPLLWKFVVGTSIIRLLPVLYLTLDSTNVFRHHYDPKLAGSCAAWLTIQVAILYLQTVFGPRFFIMKGYLPALYDYHPILTQGDIETDAGNIMDSPVPHSSDHNQNSFHENSGTASESSSITSQTSLLGSKAQNQDSKSFYSSTGHDHKGKGKHKDEDAKTSLLHHEDADHHHHASDRVMRRGVDCAICMMPIELCITPRDSSPALLASPALMLARRRYMVTPCRHVFHTECMERWMRTRLQCPICRNPLPAV